MVSAGKVRFPFAKLLFLLAGLSAIALVGCSAYPKSSFVLDIEGRQEFAAEVLGSSGIVSVMFYTPTCPACRRIMPLLDEIAERWKTDMKFVTVDCYKNRALAQEYAINIIPRFFFFKDGKKMSGPLAVRSQEELHSLFREQFVALKKGGNK